MSKRTRKRIEQINETCTARRRVQESIVHLQLRYQRTETEPAAHAAANKLFLSNVLLQNSMYRLCRDYQRLKDFLSTATLDHPDFSVDIAKLNKLRDKLMSSWRLGTMFKMTVHPHSTPDDQIKYSPTEPLHDHIWNLASLTHFVLEHEGILDMYIWRRYIPIFLCPWLIISERCLISRSFDPNFV